MLAPFFYSIGLLLWLSGPDVAVVSAPGLKAELAPWVAYRAAQGHRVVWIPAHPDPRVIRRRIIEQAGRSRLRAVLIVGDHAGPFAVPTFHLPAEVNIHFGSEALLASDGPYGDLDGDRRPDLPVGRWSVESAQQVAWQIEKVQVFETARGSWRKQLHLVVGMGGFGPVIDGAIELGTKRLLTRGVPGDYQISLTRASWQSPFCPAPEAFRDCVIDRLNEGGIFWVYMGHGHWNQLDSLRVPGNQYPILLAEDAGRLQYRHAPSIALFLSCYAGAFDVDESLAERFVRARGGPVAAIAASRVSMPFGMTVLATGLMDGYFEGRRPTLGEIWFASQQRLMARRLPLRDRWLEWTARRLSPKPELLASEKREHVFLFNLLGDPLLRLPQPQRATLAVLSPASRAEPLVISVDVPFSGRGYLTLMNPRQTPRFPLAERTQYRSDRPSAALLTEQYHRANDLIWKRMPVEFSRDGTHRLSLDLKMLSTDQDRYRLCLYLENEDGRFATAVHPLVVAPPLEAEPDEGRDDTD